MIRRARFRIANSMVALTVSVGPWLLADPVYAQTQGMERRDDRREDRQDARDTRHEGRDEARDIKRDD